jgi:hypothetical protein
MMLNVVTVNAFCTSRTKRAGVYVGRNCALNKMFSDGSIGGGDGGGTVLVGATPVVVVTGIVVVLFVPGVVEFVSENF